MHRFNPFGKRLLVPDRRGSCAPAAGPQLTIENTENPEPGSGPVIKPVNISRLVCRTMFLILLFFIFPGTSGSAGDGTADIFGHASGIWQMQGTAGQKQWLVIHNLEEARSSGLFHIEILGHDTGRPAWAIVHIRNHMAITLEALKRSVTRPLKGGAVYPESFDWAYAKWKQEADQGRPNICRTTISDCLGN